MMFGHNNHSNDMSGNKTKSVTDLAVNGISVYLSLCYSETPQKKSIYVILKRIFKKWNGLAKIIDNAMLKKENKGKRKQVKEFDRTISRHCSKDITDNVASTLENLWINNGHLISIVSSRALPK